MSFDALAMEAQTCNDTRPVKDDNTHGKRQDHARYDCEECLHANLVPELSRLAKQGRLELVAVIHAPADCAQSDQRELQATVVWHCPQAIRRPAMPGRRG